MTTVLKLGGSVVTEKGRPETVDREALERAAAALGTADDLVVVHGGGSFGHHHATEHGVTTTEGTTDAEAVRAIHGAMKRLNAAVVEALADAGSPAVPVHPLSIASRDGANEVNFPMAHVASMLDEGFVPVLHGDIIVHEDAGATILSGDELVVAIASSLAAERVGVCSAVPGVYDADGEVIERIGSLSDAGDALGESDVTDVTGGMAAKVRELLALEAEATIFGVDGLEAFLAGENPGTLID